MYSSTVEEKVIGASSPDLELIYPLSGRRKNFCYFVFFLDIRTVGVEIFEEYSHVVWKARGKNYNSLLELQIFLPKGL